MGLRGRFYSYTYHVINVGTGVVIRESSPYKGDSAQFLIEMSGHPTFTSVSAG